MEELQRDFKGIWIPKEVLALGLPTFRIWVKRQYGIDLYAENPVEEGESK
jgi:hypothetical protein